VPCDDVDRLLVANCTRITLGDGNKANLWNSGWLQGTRPKDVASLIFVRTKRKKRSVASAIHNNNWTRDINYRIGFTTEHLLHFTTLWSLVARTPLTQHHEDKISWTLKKHGEYTTASAYKAQFTDYSPAPELASLWKA
jgi:hypothetical protein